MLRNRRRYNGCLRSWCWLSCNKRTSWSRCYLFMLHREGCWCCKVYPCLWSWTWNCWSNRFNTLGNLEICHLWTRCWVKLYLMLSMNRRVHELSGLLLSQRLLVWCELLLVCHLLLCDLRSVWCIYIGCGSIVLYRSVRLSGRILIKMTNSSISRLERSLLLLLLRYKVLWR